MKKAPIPFRTDPILRWGRQGARPPCQRQRKVGSAALPTPAQGGFGRLANASARWGRPPCQPLRKAGSAALPTPAQGGVGLHRG
eukprot:349804-Chlamydomonas_euryale.AAC.4